MKKNIAILAATIAAALLIPGCASKPARYVDSKGPNTIVSLNQINIQDFEKAADDLVVDIIASGVLERAPQQPAIMAISRITNQTTDNFDMDSLVKKIRAALLKTGKVVTTTTLAYSGVEDPLARGIADKNAHLTGTPATPTPYYTLSGKILEDKARAGKTNQTTYIFQLTLTTVKDGLGVWEGEKLITKQGRVNSVGW